ncbi:universal stress protein E [Halopseudomonas sabulinigri]|uniref:Universal stress protein E n=1 Tax=Halopseudomonas sabulinigri TaxID=472181 RepID=A0A1H1PU60_9GAMM|nr:universal stress protein [Halopseudomonas sabulinigri]SDS14259.1 universal stress protein E [Halopseudomonas sabulinigri]
MNINHLLVVIDPTTEEQQPCLARAENLVQSHPEARLTLLLCDYVAALDGGTLFESNSLEKARASLLHNHTAFLERLAAPLRAQGLQVDVQAVWGKRLDRHILQAAQQLKPDIVLKTTHHHNALKRLFLTNTDWQLIRHCEAPLWLVKRGEQPITQIGAAVDPLHIDDKPASLDLKLINEARALADSTAATLHLVHCYNPLPRTMVVDATLVVDYQGYADDVKKQHTDAFSDLLGRTKAGQAQQHLLKGYPEEAIPQLVEKLGINLLLLGAVSRSRMESALIGHTAERLLDEVPCDLLIIKPDDFRDPSKPA